MSYTVKRTLRDTEQFELYLQTVLNEQLLYQQELNSNSPGISNIELTTTRNYESHTFDLNFATSLTNEQILLLDNAISSYVETYNDDENFNTVPQFTSLHAQCSSNYMLLNSFRYSGSYNNEELKKIRINSRMNNVTSNANYSLRIVDITNNKIMGSNNYNNVDYNYNTIELINVPSKISTIEVQGKNNNNSFIDINGIQLVYKYR